MINLVQQAHRHPTNTAVLADGQTYTYSQLLEASAQFGCQLLNGQTDLSETRVAFMVEPGFEYVNVQWGIWQAGGIAVPLCITYPPASLQYVIDDTASAIVVASTRYAALLRPIIESRNIRFIELGQQKLIQRVICLMSIQRGGR